MLVVAFHICDVTPLSVQVACIKIQQCTCNTHNYTHAHMLQHATHTHTHTHIVCTVHVYDDTHIQCICSCLVLCSVCVCCTPSIIWPCSMKPFLQMQAIRMVSCHSVHLILMYWLHWGGGICHLKHTPRLHHLPSLVVSPHHTSSDFAQKQVFMLWVVISLCTCWCKHLWYQVEMQITIPFGMQRTFLGMT